MQVTWP